MEEEIAENPGSTAAGYWLAAAARANGNLERAWHAAQAGWLRAVLADDRGAALRADLDKLVTTAIVPERAAKLAGRGDPKEAQTALLAEWEAFKKTWTKSVQDVQLFASFQFSPIPTSTVERHVQRDRVLHRAARTARGGFVGGFLRRFEQQLVVDGEDHAGAAAGDGRQRRGGRRSSPA